MLLTTCSWMLYHGAAIPTGDANVCSPKVGLQFEWENDLKSLAAINHGKHDWYGCSSRVTPLLVIPVLFLIHTDCNIEYFGRPNSGKVLSLQSMTTKRLVPWNLLWYMFNRLAKHLNLVGLDKNTITIYTCYASFNQWSAFDYGNRLY